MPAALAGGIVGVFGVDTKDLAINKICFQRGVLVMKKLILSIFAIILLIPELAWAEKHKGGEHLSTYTYTAV